MFRSIDYPVKWFVVVVGEQVAAGKNAIAYEVKHLLEYPQDKVGEGSTCRVCVCVWCSAAHVGAVGALYTSVFCQGFLAWLCVCVPQASAEGTDCIASRRMVAAECMLCLTRC